MLAPFVSKGFEHLASFSQHVHTGVNSSLSKQFSWTPRPNDNTSNLENGLKIPVEQSYKSNNAPAPYPKVQHSEQQYAHFCSQLCILGYETGALWDLWIWSITLIKLNFTGGQVNKRCFIYGICLIKLKFTGGQDLYIYMFYMYSIYARVLYTTYTHRQF